MAVRIEILATTSDSASIALYYPVAAGSRLSAANDQARAAAGTRLSAQELQDLKDGALFEIVRSFSIRGMTPTQARTRLERMWTELQDDALAEYAARYRFAHAAWDGSAWS